MNYFLLVLTGFVLLGIGIHESHAVNQYVNKVSGEVSDEISSGRSSHDALIPSVDFFGESYDYAPPVVAEFRIQSIERGIDDDDDKLLLGTITEENKYVTVIVRDKLEIIENVLRPGMIFEYTGSLINDARELRVDFTDTFRFLNEKGNVIIDRKIVTHAVDNQQIGLIMYGDPTLLTVNENSDDCMEGQFEVCHPNLLFQTYSGQEILEEEVSRGVPIDIFSNNGERTVVVSDAHTYGEYRNDRNFDYARLEFLGIYPNGASIDRSNTFQRNNLPTHRFCTSFFESNESIQGYSVEYTCTKKGERIIRKEKRKAFWKNLMIKIRGEKDTYDYVVC